MLDTQLRLPHLESKPRQRGLTMVIDPGMFTAQFEDGIWHVSGKKWKFVLGGGTPIIEVRDRDSKTLKIYFAR